MSLSQSYNFCPNCGAVTKDGICTACGHKVKGASKKAQEPAFKSDKTVFDYTQTDVTTSFGAGRGVLNGGTGSKKNGSVILLAVISFALIAGILYMYSRVRLTYGTDSSANTATSHEVKVSVSTSEAEKPESVTDSKETSEAYSGYFKKIVSDNFSSLYLKDEEAYAEEDLYDYSDETGYYVYDDYIRTDVGYDILNGAWEYNGYNNYLYDKNAPENVYIYCTFPNVMGPVDIQGDINNTIVEKSMYICDMYEADCEYLEDDQMYYGDEHVYVTYMDEDVLSLLFFYDGYIVSDSEDEPKLISSTADTVNYDMRTGKEIKMPKISMSDDKFIDKFIEEVNAQNYSDILEDVDKLDLLMDFKAGKFKWFYNPFGVEIVYNVPYNYGFYSCTMDPDEIFAK